MNQKIRPSIWFCVILVAAFVGGYMIWAQANAAWPFDQMYYSYPENHIKR